MTTPSVWERIGLRIGSEDDHALVSLDLGFGWVAYYKVIPQAGRPVIAEVRVSRWGNSTIPKGGLPGRLLQLRTREVLRVAGEVLFEDDYIAEIAASVGFSRAFLDEPKRPGRGGRPDWYYAEIAQMYADLLNPKFGKPDRTPVETIAGKLRRSNASVRELVYVARSRGLLSPLEPHTGKAGGQLTAKGRRALRQRSRRDTQ